MDFLLGNLISSMFNFVITSFIGAVSLQLAVRWIQKIKAEFWNAYMTVLLSGILNLVLIFIIGVAMTAGRVQFSIASQIICALMLPIGFLIQAGFVSSRIKIPFGRACLVSLAMFGIILAIAALVIIAALILCYVIGR